MRPDIDWHLLGLELVLGICLGAAVLGLIWISIRPVNFVYGGF